MEKRAIPYGKQYISQEDINAVVETLKSDFLTQGPKIKEFEEVFAKYVGAKYAVAVSNGTAALHLSALALDVRPGKKVITTPITFAASANCVLYAGGEVDFVDIDPETYVMDLDKLEEKLENSPKGTYSGVIPVDFTGYPINLERLSSITEKHNLWILEDACHAPGGYFIDSKNKKQYCGNGQFAELAIFSFHPVKHIATGEGGLITTNDEKLYKRLQLLRTHGISKDPKMLQENHGGWYYEMHELGYNYRLSDIQAALGVSQMNRAEEGLKRRQEIAHRYDEAFKGTSIKIQKNHAQNSNGYHLYVIQTQRRKELYEYLRQHKIYTQVHYIPVHLQPYYQRLGWKKGDFPVAEAYYEKCLSLPMFPTLTNEELSFIINTIRTFIQ